MRLSTHLPLAVVALAAAVQAHRMTMQEFLAADSLPVPFTSQQVAWLKVQDPVFAEDKRIIEAVNNQDRSDLRNLVACKICRKCMHSSTLVTTECGHGFHAECFREHVETKGEFCPTCGNKGPHTDLWKRTVLREALGIFDDGSWIPANPGHKVSERINATEYSKLDSLQVDFASNEIRWLGAQKIVGVIDKDLITAVKDSNSELLYESTFCSICMECMHSTTIMTTNCGHTFHARCFKDYSKNKEVIPCPLCRDVGPHNNFWRGTLLKDTLRLFENEGWIPEVPKNGAIMTLGEFMAGKPLPIDFSSVDLQNLARQKLIIDPDYHVVAAIEHKNPNLFRALIICPVCSQPMHADTLGVTSCDHLVHRDCFSVYFDNIGDMCPVCNKGGPHQPLQRKSLLSVALKLFEREDWMPPNPERMTMEQFMITKSLPVDFESPEIQWLVRQEVQFGSEEKLLDAIKTRNREGIRDAVACPICKKCIHSASLKMAACGHAFHEECIVDQLKCLSTDGSVQCACPVCSEVLTSKSNITAPAMFRQALYLFEVEGWIPARGTTGISARELARLSPFRPFVPPEDWDWNKLQFRPFVPPKNWLGDLLPAILRLPVESDALQAYRYFVRDRFLAHIAMFIRVMNEVASALYVCEDSSIVKRIIADHAKGRALAYGMCYLPRPELKLLNPEVNKITDAGLRSVLSSYGYPIMDIKIEGNETLIYIGNIRKAEKTADLPKYPITEITIENDGTLIYIGNKRKAKKTADLSSFGNGRKQFRDMQRVHAFFKSVLPVGDAYNIPEVPVPRSIAVSELDYTQLLKMMMGDPAAAAAAEKENREDRNKWLEALPEKAAFYRDVPKVMADWLRTIAEKDGPVKSALEMGVRLIFEDTRLDWMRKAAEWLLGLKLVTSRLLERIKVPSESMVIIQRHFQGLMELILKPVLSPGDLESKASLLKEMEMGTELVSSPALSPRHLKSTRSPKDEF